MMALLTGMSICLMKKKGSMGGETYKVCRQQSQAAGLIGLATKNKTGCNTGSQPVPLCRIQIILFSGRQ